MDLRARVDANPLWYHTLDLAPGVVTPGWFDLRPIVARMPWPDVRGKRCLDVGTYDGFLAFELEWRGAAEVVATDIAEHARWDWPWRTRAAGPDRLRELAGPRKGLGFEIAKEALGSSVERREVSIYDLAPEEHGRFDVVVCGSLLLHLRDPVRALEAVRSVCAGHLLSAETVDTRLSLLSPRRPAAWFRGGDRVQWWIPNVAGHRLIVEAGGFRIDGVSRRYRIPLGAGHPARRRRGVAHAALLAQPDAGAPAAAPDEAAGGDA